MKAKEVLDQLREETGEKNLDGHVLRCNFSQENDPRSKLERFREEILELGYTSQVLLEGPQGFYNLTLRMKGGETKYA